MKSATFVQAWCLFAALTDLSAASPVSLAESDAALVDRETGCVALGSCPGMDPPRSSSMSPTPSPTPSPSSSSTPLPVNSPSGSSSSPAASSSGGSSQPTTSPTPSPTDGRKGPDPTLSIARASMSPYLYGCNRAQEAAVRQAWDEANTLAQAHKEWQPPGWFSGSKWQPAMDMYLGTDSSKDNTFFGGAGPLKENILRESGIHQTDETYSPYWSYTYMYCDETKVPRTKKAPPIGECGKANTPGKKVAAYTFADDGTIFGWNAKYVVLCPRFFEDEILSLKDATAKAQKDTSLAQIMDNWRRIKACVLFHESYHWSPEVSQPQAVNRPEIYDPAQVVQLAKTSNIAKSKLNAESWTQAAVAIYLQKTFKLKNPPVPKDMAAAQGISTASSNTPDDIETKWLSEPPAGFDPPVPVDASNFVPNMANNATMSGGSGATNSTNSTPRFTKRGEGLLGQAGTAGQRR